MKETKNRNENTQSINCIKTQFIQKVTCKQKKTIEKMCNDCEFIRSIFRMAKIEKHKNYTPIVSLLEELEIQNRIELILADCKLGEAKQILYSEKHYTLYHYFKCLNCENNFRIGACIRGEPLYESDIKIDKVEVSKRLWGKVGSFFSKQ